MYFVSYSSLSIYIRGRLNKNKKLEKKEKEEEVQSILHGLDPN